MAPSSIDKTSLSAAGVPLLRQQQNGEANARTKEDDRYPSDDAHFVRDEYGQHAPPMDQPGATDDESDKASNPDEFPDDPANLDKAHPDELDQEYCIVFDSSWYVVKSGCVFATGVTAVVGAKRQHVVLGKSVGNKKITCAHVACICSSPLAAAGSQTVFATPVAVTDDVVDMPDGRKCVRLVAFNDACLETLKTKESKTPAFAAIKKKRAGSHFSVDWTAVDMAAGATRPAWFCALDAIDGPPDESAKKLKKRKKSGGEVADEANEDTPAKASNLIVQTDCNVEKSKKDALSEEAEAAADGEASEEQSQLKKSKKEKQADPPADSPADPPADPPTDPPADSPADPPADHPAEPLVEQQCVAKSVNKKPVKQAESSFPVEARVSSTCKITMQVDLTLPDLSRDSEELAVLELRRKFKVARA